MVLSLFDGSASLVNGSCPWLKQPIPCDFALYTNATNLTDSQKLLPNTDITGTQVMILFVVSTYLALALSVLLLGDEAALLVKARYDKLSDKRHKSTLILLHTIDTLLHALSDSQITAGLALLLATSFHDSCISAYHYNVVCYLMLMSLTTHVLVFVNVPDYGAKNHAHAAVRLAAIIATLCVTWELFTARGAKTDCPVAAVSLAVMPSACFVGGGNGTSSSVLSGLEGIANVSKLLSEGASGTGGQCAFQYSYRFGPLAGFFVIGLLFLTVDWCQGFTKFDIGTAPERTRKWLVLSCRGSITLALTILATMATAEFLNLRMDFEGSQWYLKDDEDTTSLGQLITLLLAIPSLFAIVRVLCESIDGPRSGDKVVTMLAALKNGNDTLSDHESQVELGLDALKNREQSMEQ